VRGCGHCCRKSPPCPCCYLPRRRVGASDVRGGDLRQLRLGCGWGVLEERGLNVQLRHLFTASTIPGSIYYYVELSSNLVLGRKWNFNYEQHHSLAEYFCDVAHSLSLATLRSKFCADGHLILDLRIQFFMCSLLQSALSSMRSTRLLC
jgi:hypothetical protein